MRAFVLSLFVEVQGVETIALPVILIQVIISFPTIPDRLYCETILDLYVHKEGVFRLISIEVQEIPFGLYLAGQ